MSDEISAAPVPWKVADQYVMRDARDIRDANGALVAIGVSSADARLIVDAVNDRERMRDLVKRMADKLEVHRGIFTASNVWSETGCHETCSLIREARAALREDKP